MKKLLFITLINILLISCQTDAQTKDNQMQSKNTVHIVSESLSKEEEALKIVWDIETVLQDIYKMKAPVSDLEEKKHLKLSDATRKHILQGYYYEPRLNYFVISSDTYVPFLDFNSVSSYTLEEIQSQYAHQYIQYKEDNFGSIDESIIQSDLYTDGYFYYVFTKHTMTFDHFKDLDLQEIIIYKKYLIMEGQEGLYCTDLDIWYDYDHKSVLKSLSQLSQEHLSFFIESHNKYESKFFTILNQKIEF